MVSSLPDVLEKLKPAVFKLKYVAGIGTAFSVDKNGFLVTNRHVVGTGFYAKVIDVKEKEIQARVIISDTVTDLAILYLKEVEITVPEWIKVEDLKVGMTVLAIGNPLGYDFSVSKGIISSVKRTINSIDYIQTDVPINPGNSGGPLIVEDGRVCGVNSWVRSDAQSIGFATPMRYVESLVKKIAPYLDKLEEAYYCPKCGWLDDKRYKYCRNCGVLTEDPLAKKGEEIKTEEKPAGEEEKKPVAGEGEFIECPSCKYKNKLDAKYCSQCGTKL
ncbi:MAG: trypsin-like peptidase domain-containing protein [bacterium]